MKIFFLEKYFNQFQLSVISFVNSFISYRHCAQRGIYLTFGDACVIISVCKALLRHQMCPERLPEEHKTSVPLVRRRHLWRVGPSTRGATAPQGAQQVNFVVRRVLPAITAEATDGGGGHKSIIVREILCPQLSALLINKIARGYWNDLRYALCSRKPLPH